MKRSFFRNPRGLTARYNAAYKKGKFARHIGQTEDDCPYKDGEFSMKSAWLAGYGHEKDADDVNKNPNNA